MISGQLSFLTTTQAAVIVLLTQFKPLLFGIRSAIAVFLGYVFVVIGEMIALCFLVLSSAVLSYFIAVVFFPSAQSSGVFFFIILSFFLLPFTYYFRVFKPFFFRPFSMILSLSFNVLFSIIYLMAFATRLAFAEVTVWRFGSLPELGYIFCFVALSTRLNHFNVLTNSRCLAVCHRLFRTIGVRKATAVCRQTKTPNVLNSYIVNLIGLKVNEPCNF